MRQKFRQIQRNAISHSYRMCSRWKMSFAFLLVTLSGLCMLIPQVQAVDHQPGSTIQIGVLMSSAGRQESVDGFREGVAEHGKLKKMTYVYSTKNAEGDRTKLLPLAREIIAAHPDIAIAAGGLEADALRIASQGSGVPVVFLIVASSVDRGLAESMLHPGGNMTGIDTNDTVLTEKRLWYISKLFPDRKRVLCLNVPDIKPSAESVRIASEKAPGLGLILRVIDVQSKEDIPAIVAGITRENTDVIMLNPCAPILQSLKDTLLPLSLQQKIPIMAFSEEGLALGAVVSYGGSRHAIGRQGARLAVKVLHGADPANVPIETPDQLDLAINRSLLERLDIVLPKRAWRLANSVVKIDF